MIAAMNIEYSHAQLLRDVRYGFWTKYYRPELKWRFGFAHGFHDWHYYSWYCGPFVLCLEPIDPEH